MWVEPVVQLRVSPRSREMPMRPLLSSCLTACLMLGVIMSLAGCNNGGTPPPPPTIAGAPPSSAAPLKVGLLLTGPESDSGWNQLAGQGLERIKAELGAEIVRQTATKAQAEESLRGLASDGCTLIIAHGSEYGDAAAAVAKDYPKVVFAVSSGEVEGENLASLRFDLGEAAYLAGMVAASLSKTGKAGQIGGEGFPPVKQAFELFEKGGQAINPKFSAPIVYLGSWTDANAAKEKALGFIRDGADILFQNADAAGFGVFEAAKDNKGVLVIGSNANQNAVEPEIIAASAVLDVPKAFLAVARDVQQGVFKGGVFREDLKSENVYLAISDRFASRIPAEVKQKVDQARTDILSGKLKLVHK